MAPEASKTPVSSARQARVLFVDDDPVFLQTVAELMSGLSQGRWEILTAGNASEALQVLHSRPVDLVVLDVEMQAIDGIQVLSLLNRSHPHLQKAVLTGYATENYRAACLAQGAELFLEKPTRPEGWASVHAALQQLLDFPPERGFRGVLRRVGLTDILQLECLGKSSSVLEVTAGSVTGRIYIDQGRIVHAELGEATGEAAFYRLLALPGGQFVVQPFREPPERSIGSPWEFLLMEAARLRDELQAELHAEDKGTAGAAPVESTPAVSAGQGPDSTAGQVRDSLPSKQEASVGRAMVQRTAPAGPEAARCVPEPGAPTSERQGARELLICDAHGEILYEWNCPERAAWVNVIEFVSQKATRMVPADQFGEFDRLEMACGGARWLLLLRADRAVLMGWGTPLGSSIRPPAGFGVMDSRSRLIEWLRGTSAPSGVVLRALRFPDRTVSSDVELRDLPSAWLEHIGRGILDTYEVLAAHRIHPDRLRWRYARGAIDCARREDGTLLLMFSPEAGVCAGAEVVVFLDLFRRGESAR
ncbi:MAG: response regulator [Limisphaera sp.]|nr:response regulator [Limisphaera sp.]